MTRHDYSSKLLAAAVLCSLLSAGPVWAADLNITETVTPGNNASSAGGDRYKTITVGNTSVPVSIIGMNGLAGVSAADSMDLYLAGGATITVRNTTVVDKSEGEDLAYVAAGINMEAAGKKKSGAPHMSVYGTDTLAVTATVTSQDTSEAAYATAAAYGIMNTGGNLTFDTPVQINAAATGGKVTATVSEQQEVVSNVEVYGIGNYGTLALPKGATITVAAAGGTATAAGQQTANAETMALGIDNAPECDITVGGPLDIKVTAAGGTATGGTASSTDAGSRTHALGINEESYSCLDTSQPVTLTVTATGGTSSGSCYTEAIGLFSTSGVNGDVIMKQVKATGGAAGTDSSVTLAAGIATQYGIAINVNNLTITNVEAIAGTSQDSSVSNPAQALGIKNRLGTVQVKGDTVINAKVSNSDMSGSQAAAVYTSGRGGSKFLKIAEGEGEEDSNAIFTNINTTDGVTSLGKTVQLEGDVVALDGGVNNIILDGQASYLRGNVLTTGVQLMSSYFDYISDPGTNNILVRNGASWQPVYDNRNGSFVDYSEENPDPDTYRQSYTTTKNSIAALTLQDGGVVDLTWDNGENQNRSGVFRTLSIGTLTGDGGIFKVNTDLSNNEADEIILGSGSTSTAVGIDVAYDPFLVASGLAVGSAINGSARVLTDNSGKITTVSGVADSYNLYEYTPTIKDNSDHTYSVTALTITNVKPAPNPGKKDITEPSRPMREARHDRMALHNLWVNGELNNMQKRMGDLRTATPAESGIWARYEHNKLEKGSDSSLKYNMFQLGFDKDYQGATGTFYRGAAFSYSKGSGVYEVSSGDIKQNALSLYQTWIGQDGRYYDVIVKAGKIMSNYDYSYGANQFKGDYSNWAYSISGEVGKRFKKSNGFYVEPQLEFILSKINGADYTTSTGMNVSVDSQSQAIARLGLGVGREVKNGSYYARASYYHDFGGGLSLTASDATTNPFNYGEDAAKNWVVFTLGGQARAGKNCNIYGELSKYAGQLSNNVLVNIGARWSF